MKGIQDARRAPGYAAPEFHVGPSSSALLWARRGTACAENGDPIGALRCFRRAIETDLDCVAAWAGLVDVFTHMRDRRRAEGCLDVVKRLRAQDETFRPIP